MIARMLYLILGAVIYLCSTPAGMAQKSAPVEARADLFAGTEFEEKTEIFVCCQEGKTTEAEISAESEDFGEAEQRAAISIERFALLPSLWGAEQADSSVDGSKQTKRVPKRASSKKLIISKCRILTSLTQKAQARGIAKHPESQDAEQERTAAIRFLQFEALAC